ncbi:SRPBCC family protein [Mycetocola zhujimingii]|uniref:SRPBCC domain-containing protein n=1 Tax=Mycetocola zhujimingii TaxID=2079792 RepID=A0A2U1TCM0_9MICO|nr:SRPBCC domain-containing protein [Mycetocola zhujimingii]PWC06635.1 SRPBCC domain-containing protein [Mycetocola zhujimingii]
MGNSSSTFEVRVTREFPVPVDSAYAAWTTPELLMQWWGPLGFTCPVANLDVRVGGVSLVAMRAPAQFGGGDMFNTWTYTLVDPPNRLEFEMRFTDANGEAISPADVGIPAGVPDTVPHVVTFASVGEGGSRLSVTEYGYTVEEARDGSQAGLDQCLDKLATLLGDGSTAAVDTRR